MSLRCAASRTRFCARYARRSQRRRISGPDVLPAAAGPARPAGPTPAGPAAVANAAVMDGAPFRGDIEVTLATTAECIEKWFREKKDWGPLGFDTETQPSFTKGPPNPPATLQLSTRDKCLVVHLTHLDTVPSVLANVLSSRAVLKVGVGVNYDAAELWVHHGLAVNGRVDLTLGPASARWKTSGLGLGKLVEQVLGVSLGKSKRLTMTNWAKRTLSQRELQYCALDAWAGRAVYDALHPQQSGVFDAADTDCFSCAELLARRRVREGLKQLLHEPAAGNAAAPRETRPRRGACSWRLVWWARARLTTAKFCASSKSI